MRARCSARDAARDEPLDARRPASTIPSAAYCGADELPDAVDDELEDLDRGPARRRSRGSPRSSGVEGVVAIVTAESLAAAATAGDAVSGRDGPPNSVPDGHFLRAAVTPRASRHGSTPPSRRRSPNRRSPLELRPQPARGSCAARVARRRRARRRRPSRPAPRPSTARLDVRPGRAPAASGPAPATGRGAARRLDGSRAGASAGAQARRSTSTTPTRWRSSSASSTARRRRSKAPATSPTASRGSRATPRSSS